MVKRDERPIDVFEQSQLKLDEIAEAEKLLAAAGELEQLNKLNRCTQKLRWYRKALIQSHFTFAIFAIAGLFVTILGILTKASPLYVLIGVIITLLSILIPILIMRRSIISKYRRWKAEKQKFKEHKHDNSK